MRLKIDKKYNNIMRGSILTLIHTDNFSLIILIRASVSQAQKSVFLNLTSKVPAIFLLSQKTNCFNCLGIFKNS